MSTQRSKSNTRSNGSDSRGDRRSSSRSASRPSRSRSSGNREAVRYSGETRLQNKPMGRKRPPPPSFSLSNEFVRVPEGAFVYPLMQVLDGIAEALFLGTNSDPNSPLFHTLWWSPTSQGKVTGEDGVSRVVWEVNGIVSLNLQPGRADLLLREHVDWPDPERNVQALRALRGLKFDYVRGKIACVTFGHTLRIVADSIEEAEDRLQLNLGRETLRKMVARDGVVIMLFRYEGVDYISTFRRIDASKSFYGPIGSPLFTDLMKKFGVPSFNELFGGVRTGDIAYYFMIAHESVLQSSKEIVGSGYATYLGFKYIRNSEQQPVETMKIAEFREPANPQTLFMNMTPTNVHGANLYLPVQIPDISPEYGLNPYTVSNNFLRWSFFPEAMNYNTDKLFTPGGAIVVLQQMDEGEMSINPVIHIVSRSYQYRTKIQGNTYNPVARLQEIRNFCRIADKDTHYGQFVEGMTAIPMIRRKNGEIVKLSSFGSSHICAYLRTTFSQPDSGMICYPLQLKHGDVDIRDAIVEWNELVSDIDLFINAAIIYLLTSPANRQRAVIEAIEGFLGQSDRVVTYVENTYSDTLGGAQVVIGDRTELSPEEREEARNEMSSRLIRRYGDNISWFKNGLITNGAANFVDVLINTAIAINNRQGLREGDEYKILAYQLEKDNRLNSINTLITRSSKDYSKKATPVIGTGEEE